MDKKPKVGLIVNFVYGMEGEEPVIRPMQIVRVWDKDSTGVNGIVSRDGTNDDRYDPVGAASGALHVWKTSVKYSDPENKEIGTWHWPE